MTEERENRERSLHSKIFSVRANTNLLLLVLREQEGEIKKVELGRIQDADCRIEIVPSVNYRFLADEVRLVRVGENATETITLSFAENFQKHETTGNLDDKELVKLPIDHSVADLFENAVILGHQYAAIA